MRKRKHPPMILLLLLLGAGLYSACLPIPGGSQVTVNEATAEPTLTSTIIWFPPTNTPKPTEIPATKTPTPEQRPGIGNVLFEDDFTKPALWLLGRFDGGSIALGLNEITLATSSPKALLVTFRQEPTLSDFYAEVTISPNLCALQDAYGLAFRAGNFTDYYAFLLSCDGQVRLERDKLSERIPLENWSPVVGPVTSDIGGRVKLGVWAQGREMRFFVNGIYQFSVNDPSFPRGLIGLIIRSAGETSMTANFSDLVVKAVSSVAVQPTSVPTIEEQ
jgi:hypothetical protein